MPRKKKATDLSENGSILNNYEQTKKRNINHVQLRIDKSTIILVHKKNATEKYASEYINKLEISRNKF